MTDGPLLICMGQLIGTLCTFMGLAESKTLSLDQAREYYSLSFVAIIQIGFGNPDNFIQKVNSYQITNDDFEFINTLQFFIEKHNRFCPNMQIEGIMIPKMGKN